jgi:organic hydroperoxide reductase OsmC/OhrA
MAGPPAGVPRVSFGSESVPPLPLSVNPDVAHPLATGPGELLAGAIGSVFAWLAAEQFMAEGTQARELTAHVTLTLDCELEDQSDLALRAIGCELVGRIPDIDEARMLAVAQRALTRCVAALAMRADAIALNVETRLEGA